MSPFKSLLFTDEPRRFVVDLRNDADGFGPTYGNHIANGKAFAEPWKHRPDPSSQACCAAGACCAGVDG
jgi:hypothetical protein